MKQLKHLHVTCAIIERKGLVLAAQRSASMSMPLKWEFPGGKVNPGEGYEECLLRELSEELGISAVIGRALVPTTHHYPAFTITLYPFVCSMRTEKLSLNEHAAIRWVHPTELRSLDWAEADIPIVSAYLQEFRRA
jgi:8-oxo-dGTP diphosphatase